MSRNLLQSGEMPLIRSGNGINVKILTNISVGKSLSRTTLPKQTTVLFTSWLLNWMATFASSTGEGCNISFVSTMAIFLSSFNKTPAYSGGFWANGDFKKMLLQQSVGFFLQLAKIKRTKERRTIIYLPNFTVRSVIFSGWTKSGRTCKMPRLQITSEHSYIAELVCVL